MTDFDDKISDFSTEGNHGAMSYIIEIQFFTNKRNFGYFYLLTCKVLLTMYSICKVLGTRAGKEVTWSLSQTLACTDKVPLVEDGSAGIP